MSTELERIRLDILTIKKDMETFTRHEQKFNNTLEKVETSISSLNSSILTINLNLEHWKGIPSKIRSLEDKSIVTEIIKVAGWFVVGAFISAFIMQNYTATKEKNDYSIQKSK